MTTAIILSLVLNFVIPNATYFIYRVETPVTRETLQAKAVEDKAVGIKDAVACFAATIPLQVIGDKEHKVAAWAGSQWGEFKNLKGDYVIASEVRQSSSGSFAEFLKKNGYERIPEVTKEEDRK